MSSNNSSVISLRSLKKKADLLKTEYIHFDRQVDEEQQKLESAEQALLESTEAQEILQKLAQKVQEVAHARVAAIVTKCLQAIYEDPYEFRIVFDRKRGKTEARLVFVRDGVEVNPLKSSGGGPVDVASFALRLACLVLARPVRRPVMVLDEPFKMVDEIAAAKLAQLLSRLSDELHVQFVIVTHSKVLQAGRVVELD